MARNAIRPLLKEPTQRVADSDGGDRAARERRRRPRPRMDGARAARAARSGLDRRRLRVGPLDAGVAGERTARRLPMEGAAGRAGRRARGDRRRRLDARQAAEDRGAAADGSAAGVAGACRDARRSAAASAPEPRPTAAPAASPPKPPKIAPRAEAVIPLLHVPDDPGPEPAPDLDPEPEPTGGSRGLAPVQIARANAAAGGGFACQQQPRSLRRAQFRRFRPMPA